MVSATRGMLNANPGLLRGFRDWPGLSTPRTDPQGYLIFNTVADGLHALAVTLWELYHKEGLQSVASLIRKLAPGDDAEAFVKAVSLDMRLGPGELFDLDDLRWTQLVRAVVRFRNDGYVSQSSTMIAAAVASAKPKEKA